MIEELVLQIQFRFSFTVLVGLWDGCFLFLFSKKPLICRGVKDTAALILGFLSKSRQQNKFKNISKFRFAAKLLCSGFVSNQLPQ